MLRFSQVWGVVFREREIPCIKHIGLYEQGDDGMADYVWSIMVDGDKQCTDVAAVEVGMVPKGWQEVEPLNVVAGQTYFVEAHGIGFGGTKVTF